MVVSVEQVQNGIREFVDKEIGSKAVGFKKFGVYFMLPSINKMVAENIPKLKAIIPDAFDENGNVEIDVIYNNAKEAVKKSGQFELMGILFNESDIDKLYYYIKPKEKLSL